MLCSDTTGNMPAIRIPGIKTRDIDDFGLQEYVQACRFIREHPGGQGSGNILIEFFHGFVNKIIPSYILYRKRDKKKPLVN